MPLRLRNGKPIWLKGLTKLIFMLRLSCKRSTQDKGQDRDQAQSGVVAEHYLFANERQWPYLVARLYLMVHIFTRLIVALEINEEEWAEDASRHTGQTCINYAVRVEQLALILTLLAR